MHVGNSSVIFAYIAFQVSPSGRFIAPLHGNAVFTCICSTCDRPINWFLNGTAVVNSSDFIAIEHSRTQHGSLSVSRLSLINLSISYNLTQVQCALGTEGGVWELSQSTILLIQGKGQGAWYMCGSKK